MTRLLPLLFLLCSVLSSFAQTSPANKNRTFKLSAQSGKKIFVPGLVIVKLKEGAAPNSAAKTLSAGPVLDLKSATIESLVQKFPATNLNKSKSAVSRETDRIGLSRIYELRYFGDVDIATVINELLKDPDVEYAEPSYIAHIDYTPNDRLYSSQSYLQQVGAPQAWDVIKSSNGVIIGIVDSGSEQRHEDLSANVIGGYDLVGATSSTSTFTEDADFNVVGSANDHGVHVSGLASAVSNNGKGVASIASDAKLFIVKTAADDDPDHIYRGFDGIKYAADHGAMIINCSWGTQQYSRYEQDIVSYVISKGCLIVAAAGNIGDDGNTTPDYPAAYRGC
ncbi:S8 family serine peptidase [Arcticibacter sp. MXS-1]|uniref:S8 family serine peptidase n=1 Tax=Arcticibacter sp. MXS-1 TaxID=3341726 RepID=UPI0035A88B4A